MSHVPGPGRRGQRKVKLAQRESRPDRRGCREGAVADGEEGEGERDHPESRVRIEQHGEGQRLQRRGGPRSSSRRTVRPNMPGRASPTSAGEEQPVIQQRNQRQQPNSGQPRPRVSRPKSRQNTTARPGQARSASRRSARRSRGAASRLVSPSIRRRPDGWRGCWGELMTLVLRERGEWAPQSRWLGGPW